MPEIKPFVSVVIATYNRSKMLSECLETLSKQTYPKSSYEVVIVNDGSKDDTEAFLARYQKECGFTLRYFTQENKGQGAAINLGITQSRGDIVCFTDDDCYADKDWIKNLAAGYTDESIGCVGGTIISDEPRTLVEKYIDRKKFLVQENFLICGPVIGANTSYRKKPLLEVGGFDTELPIGLDGDLGIRVRLKGYKFYYAKDALVQHRHRSTLKGLMKWQYNYGTVVRMNKKYKRYFKPLYNFIPLPAKICLSMIKIPLRAITLPFAKEKDYHIAEPVLGMLVSWCEMNGLIHETFFGKPYHGQTYPQRIDFLRESSMVYLLGKVTRIAGVKKC
jgi:glycosyltransferase involved in cell wall biosynthesis